jgi:putative ABC transport system substrate-binding protein
MSGMKRREFIMLLGSTGAWPLAARAQQLPLIAILGSSSPAPLRRSLAAFHDSLSGFGFVENRSVAAEYRWADGQYDRLPMLAAELVSRHPAVIAAIGGTVAAIAAKRATSTVPIVFTGVTDPVASGLVASLNRPGGNVTGASVFSGELEPKKLGLLRQLLPTATIIGVLVNRNNSISEIQSRELQKAAAALGLQLVTLNASTAAEIEAAFGTPVEQKANGLVIAADPFFTSRVNEIGALALSRALPTIYQFGFAAAGGLMSYGNSLVESFRQAGIYVAQILKGSKPSDLPVVQPTKFELAINLKTAKTLGLTIPPGLLAIADEVIE